MEKIIENICIKLIEIIKEVIIDKSKSKADEMITGIAEEREFAQYRDNLQKKLLAEYGNESYYDNLCKILLSDSNLDVLLNRCRQRSLLDNRTDAELINYVMQDNSANPYDELLIRNCLEMILEMAYQSFNELTDPDNIKLKNILLHEEDKTRQEIIKTRNIAKAILKKQLQDKEEKAVIGENKEKTGQNTSNCIAEDITRGCKNAVKHFLGRDDDINSVLGLLEKDYHHNDKSSLWIYGMGGMGKTQLCRKLYSILQLRCPYIGWVTYTGDFRQSLVNSINRNVKADDLDKEYIEALNYINSLGRKLVIFIDNYDIMDSYLEDIESLQCHTIITSRNKNPDTFTGYELGFLDFKDCKNLFRYFYTLEDNEIMNEIIHKTGYLALAVELVAKTGEKLALPLLEYYEKLEEKGFNIATVVQSNWDNKGDKLNEALAKHFGIVFDLSSFKTDSEAFYVLQNFSILPHLSAEQKDIIKWLQLSQEDNCLFELADSGWLQKSDFEYVMHPIISYTVQNTTNPDIQDCFNLINGLSRFIRVEPGDNYLRSFIYLPYADSVGGYFAGRENIKDCDEKALALLYIRIAEIYRHNGEYQKSCHWGKLADNILENMKKSQKQTGILGNLIYNIMSEICLDMRNRNESSRDWAIKAIQSDKDNDVDEVKKSISFHNLACVYIQMGENEKALENETKAVAIRERYLSKSDVRLMNAYRNLAMIYRRLKNVDEAYRYQKLVVEGLEIIHADDKNHPDFPVAYSLYSFILRDLGKIDDAIDYQERAVKIRESINENDPKLAINYNNLGVFHLEKGKLEKAMKWQEKAIQMDLKYRGPEHPDVATDYFNYAKILNALGQTEETIQFLKISREIDGRNNRQNNVDEIDSILLKLHNNEKWE